MTSPGTYSNYVLPATERAGKWSLSMAWWALFSAMFWLYVATASAAAVGVPATLIGMGLSIVTYSVINVVLSRYAARTGLSVTLLSRSLFGIVGSALAALLFAATATYYAVFEGSIIAVAFQQYFGGPINLWYAVVVLYAVPLASGPVQRWLDRLNGWLLPIYVIGLGVAVVATAVQRPIDASWLSTTVEQAPGSLPGWATAYLIYMGIWVLMMYTFDFARLAKPQDRRFHDTVTFGWVFYLFTFVANGLVGIYLLAAWDITSAETGIVEAVIAACGFFGLVIVFVSQTRINTANYYLASTNLDAFFRRAFSLVLPRWVWVAVVGVVVFLFMLTNVISGLLTVLAWQGVLVTAWVAIALTHIFLTRGSTGLPEVRADRLPRFSPGIVVWLVVAAIGIGLLELGSGVWSQLAPVVTVVLGAAGYLIAFRVARPVAITANAEQATLVLD